MNDMTKEENANVENTAPMLNVPSAKELKDMLDQYVIGQEDAKRTLSIAVHNHYRRIQQLLNQLPNNINTKYDDIEIEKSNVLMVGPSGSGKTLLAKTLAKIIGVPFAIADATTLTAAGYVGEDVENVVRYLWQNAEGNVPLTQLGIVYIDEIDKIASKTQNVSITKDVGGQEVQNTLLKIIEGSICRFPPNGGRKHPDQQLVEIDTTNILFIVGGAFVGLDKIVDSRKNVHTVGFETSDDDNITSEDIEPEDLVKFGLIPEFIGRLPIVTQLSELSEDDLVKILTEPKNAITKQYQKLLAMDGVDLTFKPDALRAIAKYAVDKKTGARGLRSILEKLMSNIMFDVGSLSTKKIVVTKNMVELKFGIGVKNGREVS